MGEILQAARARLALPALAICLCGLLSMAPGTALARDSVVAAPHTVDLQQRRQWSFEQDRVVFSNRFDGARLNAVERIGKGRYRLTISPETTPINPSPWYGFAVFSQRPQRAELRLHFPGYKARYQPWLSRDGGLSWRKADDRETSQEAAGDMILGVDLGPRRLLVSAQRPVGLDDVACWESGLRQRPGVEQSQIGASVLGRPLQMLAFGDVAAKRVLLVLGRQHPPETTGSRALMAFVDRLAGDSPAAVEFRRSVRVLVVPVMNPDGVVEGQWRTNAAGADLNRDWGGFRQPETTAVRDMLQQQLDASGRTLAFALDFHSTWHDILYTVTEDPARAPGGILREWIDAMQARFPGRISESPSPPNTGVFKNWTYTRYAAPAVTYEVGDDTGDEQLQQLAAFAADTLMGLLSPDGPEDASR